MIILFFSTRGWKIHIWGSFWRLLEAFVQVDSIKCPGKVAERAVLLEEKEDDGF